MSTIQLLNTASAEHLKLSKVRLGAQEATKRNLVPWKSAQGSFRVWACRHRKGYKSDVEVNSFPRRVSRAEWKALGETNTKEQ